jgi:energy-coupling factor transport system ATP-binding protein
VIGALAGKSARVRMKPDPEPGASREPRVGLRLLAVLGGVVAAVVAQTIPLLAAFLLVLYAAAAARRVDVGALLRRNVPVLPIIASMVVVHGWANPANRHWIGWFGVEGLTYGMVTALRLLCFLAVANMFLLTTPVHEIVRWTRERNRDLGLMVSMAFTITPILSEQMSVTIEAQQVRGMATGPGVRAKLRAYTQVLIPVVVKALTRAEQMSLLLIARGYERPATLATSAGAGAGTGAAHGSEAGGAEIEARSFSFAYRGAREWSLRDVSMLAPVGRVSAVLGGSGSGKSTLLACVAGDPPETPSGFVSGKALVAGEPYSATRPFATVVLQNPSIHLFETPLAEVGFSFECRGMRHEEGTAAARSALEGFGVGGLAQRPLRTLSGGERQRVALAAALATAPAALVLDEPLEQLDEEGAAEVVARLRAYAGTGRAVLVATRSRELAASCDHAFGLARGRVVDVAEALPEVRIAERLSVLPGAVAVSIDHVTHRYEQGGGVEDFSLAVRAGETVALLGRNGAGKSTALRIGVGLLVPEEGTVRLLGGDPAVIGPLEVSRRAAMLFQDPDDQIFNPRVDDEIAWSLKVRGVPPEQRRRLVESVMIELGIESHASSHPHELSRSTRQLVALASALVTDPPVLFLDEPTTALDGESVARAFEAVERRRHQGTAVVLVTHDAGVASRWADRIVRIADGRTVAEGAGDGSAG